MKTIFKYITIAVVLLISLASCKSNVSNLKLSGDCQVEALTLSSYGALIDKTSRRIVVRVPEGYDGLSAMTVDKLILSEGATANIRQGETINMQEGQAIHVENGDLFLDWALDVIMDEARIYSFVINGLYTGIIDEDAKTITVGVPASVNVKELVPSIDFSAYATLRPADGAAQDFTDPVVYVVDNNTAHAEYTVTVNVIDKPTAVFLGIPATMNDLDPESLTACKWMLVNVPNSLYASFAEIHAGAVDLSECKVMWWHFHWDGGVDGHDQFVAKAPEALEAVNEIRSYYDNGGSLLLTRYAGNLASFIGATGDDEWTTPNNCWGGEENSAELCGGPWDFRKYAEHPIWENLLWGDDPDKILCTDAGYHITNSTSQYHIGTDWGGYDNYDAWINRTGAKILGVGGDGAIVAWEYPAKDGKGGIICIGSGCYDWYSYMYEPGYVEFYHANIAFMTKNAFDYLSK